MLGGLVYRLFQFTTPVLVGRKGLWGRKGLCQPLSLWLLWFFRLMVSKPISCDNFETPLLAASIESRRRLAVVNR
jgi:hypothetical protein